ncbi:MAG: nucleotidyltransferase domain-containing protein [Candidatus Bathyarchaeia archaeon]
MLKLCRVNIERSEEVFQKIEAYVQEVVEKLNPHLVVLFGSFATNNVNEGSDVDVLVVADFEEGFLDRIKTLMDMNNFGIPIEPVGYTLEEFYEMKQRKSAFILEALEKGKVMYNRLPSNSIRL